MQSAAQFNKMLKDVLLPFMGNNQVLSFVNLLAINALFLAGGIIFGIAFRLILLKILRKSHKSLNFIFIESVLYAKLINLILPICVTLFLRAYCQLLFFLKDEVSIAYNTVMWGVVHALFFIIATLLVCRMMTAIHYYFNKKYELHRANDIANYIKVVKFVIWCIAIILYLSFLLDKSPLATIAGIGAASAFFLLIFKDTFLGLMASVQSSVNNLAQVGDWITIPTHGVDGTLIAMSINTIKVQNWDNTISTLPTYLLTSTQIKNWQGMSQSGGRRFVKNININIDSIVNLDQNIANKLIAKYTINYEELEEKDQTNNLLLFKQYVEQLLNSHDKLNHNMTILTRLLDTGALGIVYQIYAFSNTVDWLKYEKIQSEITARVLLILRDFHLKVVQAPLTLGPSN